MDVALDEHRGNFRVKANCEQHGGQFHRGLTEDSRLFGDGEGMEVHNAVEDVSVVLARHPVDQSSQMVAEMDRTGGLNTRKDARHAETLLPSAHGGMVGLRLTEA